MSDNPSPSRALDGTGWDNDPPTVNLPSLSLAREDLPSPMSETSSQPSSDSLLSLDNSTLNAVVPDSTSDLLDPTSPHFLPSLNESSSPMDHGQILTNKSISEMVSAEDAMDIVIESQDSNSTYHTSSLILPDSSASYEPVVTTTRTLDQSSSSFEPSQGAGLPPVSTIIRPRTLVAPPTPTQFDTSAFHHQNLELNVMVHKADSLSLPSTDDSATMLTSGNTSSLIDSTLCDPNTSLSIHQVVSNVPITDSFGASLLISSSADSSSTLDEPNSTSLGPSKSISLLRTVSGASSDSDDKLLVNSILLGPNGDSKVGSPICTNEMTLCSNEVSPILSEHSNELSPEALANSSQRISTIHLQEPVKKLDIKQMLAQTSGQSNESVKFPMLSNEIKSFVINETNSILVKTSIESSTPNTSSLSNNGIHVINSSQSDLASLVKVSSAISKKGETSVIQPSRQTCLVQASPGGVISSVGFKRSVISEASQIPSIISKSSKCLDKLPPDDLKFDYLKIKFIKKNSCLQTTPTTEQLNMLPIIPNITNNAIRTSGLGTIPGISPILLPGILTTSLAGAIKQEALSNIYAGYPTTIPPLIRHEGTGPLPPFTVVSGLVKQELATSFSSTLLATTSLSQNITVKQEPGTNFSLSSLTSMTKPTDTNSVPFSSSPIVSSNSNSTDSKVKREKEEETVDVNNESSKEKSENNKKWCLVCKMGSPCGLHLTGQETNNNSPQASGPLLSGDPSKPYQCNLCGKHLASRNVYQLHMRSHSGEKPFTCNLCGHHFSQKTSLTRHMRSHTGERPFPCEVCGKRFADKERIKIHMRTHTGEKPFACDVCGKRFSQKSTVKRHMSVHTGEKPFKCNSCGKGFANRGNLNAHSKTHGSTSTPPASTS